jgi:hypothetical protein
MIEISRIELKVVEIEDRRQGSEGDWREDVRLREDKWKEEYDYGEWKRKWIERKDS